MQGLEPVLLRELLFLDLSRRHWQIDCLVDGFTSLTPVRGWIEAEHCGNILKVCSEASTIISLCCDRCLRQFNQELGYRTCELIWLGKTSLEEQMLNKELLIDAVDNLVDCLNPNGTFDPGHWLFEQLSLRLPTVSYCRINCPGPPLPRASKIDKNQENSVDPRWNVLRQLKL